MRRILPPPRSRSSARSLRQLRSGRRRGRAQRHLRAPRPAISSGSPRAASSSSGAWVRKLRAQRAQGSCARASTRAGSGSRCSRCRAPGYSWRPRPSTLSSVFCSSISCGWICTLKRREISNRRSRTRPKEMSLSGRSKIGSHTVRTADSISSMRASGRHPAGLAGAAARRGGSRGRTPRGSSPPGSTGRADRACRRCRSRPPHSAGCCGSSTSTKMLPGCMSAWKKLWRNTWVKKISHAVLGQPRDVGAGGAQRSPCR